MSSLTSVNRDFPFIHFVGYWRQLIIFIFLTILLFWSGVVEFQRYW